MAGGEDGTVGADPGNTRKAALVSSNARERKTTQRIVTILPVSGQRGGSHVILLRLVLSKFCKFKWLSERSLAWNVNALFTYNKAAWVIKRTAELQEMETPALPGVLGFPAPNSYDDSEGKMEF